MKARMRQNLFDQDGYKSTENEKSLAKDWFKTLRDQICAEFEKIEDELAGTRHADLKAGRLERKSWDRADGGGGVLPLSRSQRRRPVAAQFGAGCDHRLFRRAAAAAVLRGGAADRDPAGAAAAGDPLCHRADDDRVSPAAPCAAGLPPGAGPAPLGDGRDLHRWRGGGAGQGCRPGHGVAWAGLLGLRRAGAGDRAER